MKPQKPEWHDQVAEYGRPSTLKAVWQLLNSLVPYIGLWVLMVLSMKRGYSYFITLGLAVVAAGFLIRIFILCHDCVHGSFLRSKKMNRFIGYVTGTLAFTPFEDWRICHLKHHATSGDLDRRGLGDIWMMTVEEYRAASKGTRILYRIFRNPVILFGLGPILVFLIRQRFPEKAAGKRGHMSVLITDLAIAAIIVASAFTIGIKTYLLIQVPVMTFAGALGLWLFYVQHQYEGVYWERHENWDFTQAALEGSSYYKLPKILQWFSGNIGLHHIHHARPSIANYNLQSCHDGVPAMQQVEPLSLGRSLKSLWMNLWDEERRQMVSFRALKRIPQADAA